MRTITKDPSRFVPNLRESDRYENLVIASLRNVDYQRIACVINCDRNYMNWYGTGNLYDLGHDAHCCNWNWDTETSLLSLLSASWKHWKSNGNVLKIYIAESPQDVVDALEDAGVTNHIVILDILEKFPKEVTQ